jgi:hypothetical protein
LGKKGVMLHLGNPDFVNDKEGLFFGGQLFDWEFISKAEALDSNHQRGIIEIGTLENDLDDKDQSLYTQFKLQYRQQIKNLFTIARRKAKKGKIYFLTDYQFGPKHAMIYYLTHEEFWHQHDQIGIRLNTIYVITE